MTNKFPPFEDASTFVIAVLLMGGAFYGLLFSGDAKTDDHLLFAGILTAVATWAFQRNASKQATSHAIEAQNNGLHQVTSDIADMKAAALVARDKV